MKSIKFTFGRAAHRRAGPGTFLLVLWALFILDESEAREIDAREKRERGRAQQRPKPPGF
jgi:hypothetical protein